MGGMAQRLDGILVLNKPGGITSRLAIDKAWWWLPRGTRIGHAGTLDPMATGVLLVCVGRATRLIEHLHNQPKAYRADILFGASSTTDDADGQITAVPLPANPGREAFIELLGRFVGTIQQVPSAFSAVKVDGARAYTLARNGAPPELQPRPVQIDQIELLHLDWPKATIRVQCGKGTYIRSLGRDLGNALGTAAYLTELCREKVGNFTLENAVDFSTPKEEVLNRLEPLVLGVPDLHKVEISGEPLERLFQGQKLTRDQLTTLGVELPPLREGETIAMVEQGCLKVLAQWSGDQLRTRKAFLDKECPENTESA
jgi:tRNA pseudouridine55 synthase